MITIDLNLFATLSRHLAARESAFEIKENTSIKELIAIIGVSPDDVKLIFVNGKKEGLDYLIQDKDRVGLFPPVGGG